MKLTRSRQRVRNMLLNVACLIISIIMMVFDIKTKRNFIATVWVIFAITSIILLIINFREWRKEKDIKG